MTAKEFAKKIIASINPGTADISGIGDGTIKGAISEQNKNLGGLRFGVDGDGNCGYYGADGSLIPFSRFEEITALVPRLTANSSSVISSGNHNTTDFPAYKVFNRTNTNGSDCWIGSGTSGTIGYNFGSKKTIKLIYIENRNSTDTAAVKGFTLQGSDDLSSWKDIQSFTNFETNYTVSNYFFVSNKNGYKAFRIKTTSGYNSSYIAIAKLQFLGY